MRSSRTTRATTAAVAVAAVALTAACGGSSDDGNGDSDAVPGADEEASGEIQYAWWGGPARNERTQAVIDLYMDANPNVTVNGTTAEFSTYWENMTVQASGNNLPCVPQMQNRTMADYGDRGALRALDDLVESGAIDISNFPDSVIDSGRGADGNLYMIPYGAAFGSLMVNVTDVEELGFELPPDGYDWDWLKNWLLEISAETGKPEFANMGQQQDLFEAYLRGHGEDFYADGGIGFTPEGAQGYWEFLQELIDAGAMDSAEKGVEDRGIPVEQSDFAQGDRIAHSWPANGLAAAQESIDTVAPGHELAIFPLPSGPEGLGNAFWLSGLAISENCDNVAAAADFIDFFVNDEEAALAFRADNGATTNTANLQTLLEEGDISDAKVAELELYAHMAEEGVAPTIYGTGSAAIFQQAFTRFYEMHAFGNGTIEEAATQFHQEAQNTAG